MAKVKTPRWGWALTGSGHFFKECLRMIAELDEVDLFVSKAAGEVVRMYSAGFQAAEDRADFPRHHRERRPGRAVLLRHLSHAIVRRRRP